MEKNKEWHQNRYQKYKGKQKEYRDSIKEKLRITKSLFSCTDCGISGKEAPRLEFDHRIPALKEFQIGEAFRHTSWETILKEMRKCDVVCTPCHRIRTSNRMLKR